MRSPEQPRHCEQSEAIQVSGSSRRFASRDDGVEPVTAAFPCGGFCLTFGPGPLDGMVDITDLKSVRFGGAGSSPAAGTIKKAMNFDQLARLVQIGH